MRHRTHSITWHGQDFCFQWLPPLGRGNDPSQWAVSRGREFIGTMNCSLEVTTKDFDVRCLHWLSDLHTPVGHERRP
jgi:hypothetical protein